MMSVYQRGRCLLWRVLMLLVVLLAAGCQAVAELPAAWVGEAALPVTAPTAEIPTEPPPIPVDPNSIPIPQFAGGAANAGVDPLKFIFPTPGREPVSAWRPPLYPTPWEPTPHDHFYFARPVAADEVNWPNADYRYGGVFFGDQVHTGIDIPAPTGTPILAAGSGRVVWAGYGLYALLEDPSDPYGLAVAIKHDFGYEGNTLYTVYGHMDEILVDEGQHVEVGEIIGKIGTTGQTTGPHLHFEVRMGKNNFFGSRNPELWMAPPQGWGVLVGRLVDKRGNPLLRQRINVHYLDTNQYWEVITYGEGSTNSDPFYRENVVMGDLPAGNYEIWIEYEGAILDLELTIRPGMVTYFSMRGGDLNAEPPTEQGGDFKPEPVAEPPP